jgi:hypothetical protein
MMSTHLPSASRPALVLLFALILVAPLLAGCATFQSKKGLDVGPFAENTVGMIGEVQRATKPVVWVHLQKYEGAPSVLEVRRTSMPVRTLMRNVALYSTQVVSIYEARLPEERKASELARYLDVFIRERLKATPDAELFMSQGGLDSAITNVRKAPTFLEALGAAQPVVSATLSYANSIIDAFESQVGETAVDLDGKIEAEYAPLKEQLVVVSDLQVRTTRAYTLLSKYRLGDDASLDQLRAVNPEAAAAMPAGKRPPDAAMDAFEKRTLSQLETLTGLRSDLERELASYQAEEQELDGLRNQALEAARLGRVTLILWARSHRNLAAGITIPAQINVMGLVKQAAGQATKMVP